ncbi:hypothetical protein BGX26_005582, partial [Mortierella sp. AD094]
MELQQIFDGTNELCHKYKSIQEREEKLRDVDIVQLKIVLKASTGVLEAMTAFAMLINKAQ